MGFGGIGIWQLLIILAIVVLLFGTKRLSSIGTDLGKAIKGFKNSVKDDDKESEGSEDETETGDTARNVEDKADKAQADTRTEDTKADDKTRH